MFEPYEYQTLPSPTAFRLIWLFDGAEQDPLRCFIWNADARRGIDRSNDPKDQIRYCPEALPVSPFGEAADGGIVITFDALSYTWGNPYCDKDTLHNGSQDWSKTTPLMVDYVQDDLRHMKTLDITPNLDGALRRIRKHYRDISENIRFIWVDALCINQSDIAERNQQVKLMGYLYEKARGVIVWLGPGNEETAEAVAVMDLLFANGWKINSPLPEDMTEEQRKIFSVIAKEQNRRVQRIGEEHLSVLDKTSYQILGIPQISLGQWTALYSVLSRRWFKRMWIIQEVALNNTYPTVFCGMYKINWHQVFRACSIISDTSWNLELQSLDRESQRPVFGALEPASALKLDTILRETRKRGLNSYLIQTDMFECGDPRDSVYALLGLLPDEVPALSPDYNKSVATVFTEATRRIIDSSGGLQVVALATRAQNGTAIESLPSWVPDYANNIWTWTLSRPDSPFQVAGANERLKVHLSNLEVLSVDGYKWDVVKEAGGTYDKVKYGRIEEWLNILASLPATYVTGESLAEVLWRTLVISVEDSSQCRYPASSEYGEMARHWFTDVLARALMGNMYRAAAIIEDSGPLNPAEMAPGDMLNLFRLEVERENLTTQIYRLYTEKGPFPSFEEVQRTAESFLSLLEANKDTFFDSEPPLSTSKSRHFEVFLVLRGNLSRLYTTSKQYLGAGPVFIVPKGPDGESQRGKEDRIAVQPGDEVWIIPGFDTPVLLRAKESGRHSFVGATYVHGIMRGEALGGNLEKSRIDIE